MNQDALEKYKLLLFTNKANLLDTATISDPGADVVELDQTRQGRLSRMDVLQGQAMSVAAQQRRQLELQKIESALQRIVTGNFGYCLRCDIEIAQPRLDVDPAATLCVRCASSLEE